MIFFGKKRITQNSDDSYFRYRDSMTGLMSREFCFKEYEKLKALDGYCAVTVRLSGCDCMPYYEASERIKEAGGLMARACNEDVSRVENGDFVLFSRNGEEIAQKLEFFLGELSEKGERYSVCLDELDKNESFEVFLRRIQRHIGALEKSNMLQML